MAGMSEYFSSGEFRNKASTRPRAPDGFTGTTSLTEWTRNFFAESQQNMRAGGFLSPTENTLTHKNYGNNAEAGVEDTMNAVLNFAGPSAYNTEDQSYRDMRFDFITAEENYRDRMYMVNGVPHIGYGMNLDSNKDTVMDVLKLDESGYAQLTSGQMAITQRQGRALYEHAVQDAERVVAQRLEGIPLNAQQRTALVSMAYNSPALIGPNLTKHLQAGDAERVSYEILNLSNGNNLPGLDNRRKREHDMFFGSSEMWTGVTKGMDLRVPEDSGSGIGRLFGITPANAATLSPTGDASFTATMSNRPNRILGELVVNGTQHERAVASEYNPPNSVYEDGAITTTPLVPGTGKTLDEIIGSDDAPETSLRPQSRPTDAPETSLRPQLRPDDLTTGGAPETSLRPQLRPSAPATSLRPQTRPEGRVVKSLRPRMRQNGEVGGPPVTSLRPQLRPEALAEEAGLQTSLRPQMRPEGAVEASSETDEFVPQYPGDVPPELRPEATASRVYGNINDVTREVFPSFFQRLRVPTVARSFMYHKARRGTNVTESTVFDESYFNENEIETLSAFVHYLESQGKTSAQYEDYDDFFGIRDINGMYLSEIVGSAAGLRRIQEEYGKRGLTRPSDLELHEAAYGVDTLLSEGGDNMVSLAMMAMDSHDPVMALGLTIGRFSFSRDENGKIVIEDDYNFTGMNERDTAYHKNRSRQDDRGQVATHKFRLVFD